MRRFLTLFLAGFVVGLPFAPLAQAQEKKKAETPIGKDAFGDPLPIGAIARIGTLRYRLRHSQQPDSAHLSPDGKLLAMLGDQDDIEIWELPAWKRRLSIPGPRIDKTRPPLFPSRAFTADSKILLGFDLGTMQVNLFDVATGKSIKKLTLPKKEKVHRPFMMLSRDQQTLVHTYSVGPERNPESATEVLVWDVAKDQRVQYFKLPQTEGDRQSSRIISPDGRWLIQGISDEVDDFIETWDLKTGKSVRKIETENLVRSLAISPDGKWLAATFGLSLLRIYDADTGKERHNIRTFVGSPVQLQFAPDSASLYVTNDTAEIHVWNPSTGERMATHRTPKDCPFPGLAFPPGGKVVAGALDFNAIHFWEVGTGKLLSPTGVPVGPISGLAFSPQGELFVASEEGLAAWWSPRTGAKLRDLKLEHGVRYSNPFEMGIHDFYGRRYTWGGGTDLALSSNGEFLLAKVKGGGIAAVHDAKTGKLLYEDEVGRDAGVVDFLGDGTKMASISNKTGRVWSTRTGRDLTRFNIPLRDPERTTKMGVSPDGRHFAFSVDDNRDQRVVGCGEEKNCPRVARRNERHGLFTG